jgi:hypothetical protein
MASAATGAVSLRTEIPDAERNQRRNPYAQQQY